MGGAGTYGNIFIFLKLIADQRVNSSVIINQMIIFILIIFNIHIYISPHSLIASHINSHSNANTGLITNSNNNNAILGLMNNITINNNNIIIYFSLILQSSRESNPTPLPTTLPVHQLSVQLCKGTAQQLSTSSMDYTPLTQQRESHPHLLFAELQYYYTMMCYYMPATLKVH